MRFVASMLLAAPLVLGGCSNPACEDDLVFRLLDECRLAFGPVGANCFGLPGAPEGLGLEEGRAQAKASCEIADPDVDVECLNASSCEDIGNGACFDEQSDSEIVCSQPCFRSSQDCLRACGGSSDYGSCLDCELECTRQRKSCLDACPSS